ncbi:hypothetical protein [Puniceibacterium confluentis]|uniref:hypothetical protein n=1 Tax=Puniceibacterium confluentis TaxID=1958944 RepID=UPI001648D73A|nr:hypothetical protein [Puniceibacterium confluentis]
MTRGPVNAGKAAMVLFPADFSKDAPRYTAFLWDDEQSETGDARALPPRCCGNGHAPSEF